MTDSIPEPSNNRQERLPDRHIFRAFRLAVHFPQVLIAAVAVFVLALGLRAIEELPFAPKNESTGWLWRQPLATGWNAEHGTFSGDSIGGQITQLWGMLTLPLRSVVEPALELFVIGNSWSDAAYAWTRLLWGLAVWGFFAAAITRIAAVKFANQRTVGATTALRFAGGKVLSYFTAPLLPTAGILFFWLLLLVGGWIANIPAAGPILVGGSLIVALGIGLLATLIAIGVVFGWPLMAPTISTEVSDGFDGFSRSFSYVYSRPWHLARMYLLAAFCGIVGVAFSVFVACLVVHVSVWGIAAGFGGNEAAYLTSDTPFAMYDLTEPEQAAGEQAMSSFAASLAGFWLNAFALLVHGFAVSLFWSLMTVVYFAIRNVDDATAMDEVFLTPDEQSATGLPTVGVPDLDEPMTERPLEKDPGGESASPEKEPPADEND